MYPRKENQKSARKEIMTNIQILNQKKNTRSFNKITDQNPSHDSRL